MKIPVGWGVSEAKICKGKYEEKLNWNFKRGGGGGVQNKKNRHWEGYGYFLEQHNVNL